MLDTFNALTADIYGRMNTMKKHKRTYKCWLVRTKKGIQLMNKLKVTRLK